MSRHDYGKYTRSAVGMDYVGATPRKVWSGGYAGVGASYVGATPAPAWGGGYAGFGGVMVPTPLPGKPGYAADMTPTGYNYCGSKYGFQQMLQDLGYYQGQIDGKIGAGTLAAAQSFAKDHAAPWGGSLSNTFCQKLIAVWQSKVASGAPSTALMLPDATTTSTPVDVEPPTGRPNGTAPTGGQRPAGNGTSTTTSGEGALDKAKSWWSSQSTGVKIAIGVGAAGVVGLILWSLFGDKSKMVPNRKRRYRRNRVSPSAKKAALSRIRGARKKVKTGKIITLKDGRRYGHLKPPKDYWQKGAKRPSDYADPKHYKYPLIFRHDDGTINVKQTKRHIASAKGYFKRHKKDYPDSVRKTIARNINQAAARFGMAADAKP